MNKAIFFTFIFLTSCSNFQGAESLDKPSNTKSSEVSKKQIKKEDCLCMQIYAPVCSKDGKTYSNSCVAQCDGVKRFKEGACSL